MTSPFVRLHGYKVRVQGRNGQAATAPPVGTHIYLDAPGGALDFNEYVVRHDGADAYTDPPLRLDPRHAYWCVYGPDPLTPGSTFGPVTGFGYPLLARFQPDHGDSLLILPGPYDLRVRGFNASYSTDHSLQSHLDGARDFYADLHVDLHAEILAMPAGWSTGTIEVRDSTTHQTRTAPMGWSLVAFDPGPSEQFGTHAIWRDEIVDELGRPAPPTLATLPPQPNFGAAPYTTSADARTNLILAVYLNEFSGMGAAAGIAWPNLTLLPQATVAQGRRFGLSTTAMFFLRRDGHGATNRAAHEIGHCLLADAGLGRAWLGQVDGARARVQSLLGRLGLGDPRTVYASLEEHLHAATSGNLMDTHGGSSPPVLTEIEVALMRAWFEFGGRTFV
ncbi:MAG: hypothetical protein ABJE95_01755 [Byssovorax sp.]